MPFNLGVSQTASKQWTALRHASLTSPSLPHFPFASPHWPQATLCPFGFCSVPPPAPVHACTVARVIPATCFLCYGCLNVLGVEGAGEGGGGG